MKATLEPRTDSDPLVAAVRCAAAGWRDWLTAAAHLVVAGRATCGRGGGVVWAQEQLQAWAANVELDLLDQLADDLLTESIQTFNALNVLAKGNA